MLVRTLVCLIGLMLSSAVLIADDRSVLFDEEANFSSFKTFKMRDGTLASQRPELNSPIAAKKLADAIRAALTAKGLREAPDPADLVVEHAVTTLDFGIGPFGRANPINPGQRGSRGRGGSPARVDFTDATLVIDLKAGDPRALVWRGVYNATEKTAATLADTLPESAGKLLSVYPPKRKK